MGLFTWQEPAGKLKLPKMLPRVITGPFFFTENVPRSLYRFRSAFPFRIKTLDNTDMQGEITTTVNCPRANDASILPRCPHL